MTCLSVNCLKQTSQELMKQRWIKVLLFCYCIFCTFFFGSAHISKLFCWFFRESVWPKYTQHYIVINLEENFFLLIALSYLSRSLSLLLLMVDCILVMGQVSKICHLEHISIDVELSQIKWTSIFLYSMPKKMWHWFHVPDPSLVDCSRLDKIIYTT